MQGNLNVGGRGTTHKVINQSYQTAQAGLSPSPSFDIYLVTLITVNVNLNDKPFLKIFVIM